MQDFPVLGMPKAGALLYRGSLDAISGKIKKNSSRRSTAEKSTLK